VLDSPHDEIEARMTVVANEFRVVLTTAGSEDRAESIACALVERRLAACVNIVRGVRSVYRWKDEVTRDDETLLVIKTDVARLSAVGAAIRELHDYDLPEFLVLPVAGGDPDYLDWLAGGLGPA
jgi:periplasmic divalent cation tolerance protein